MDLQINKKNRESFNFDQYGIMVKDFIVSSIPLNSVYSEVDGRHGTVDYGATFGTRTITVPFNLKAYDLMDFPLLRDVLFGLVLDTESFYIREMRRPKKLAYSFVDTTEQPRMDSETDNKLVGGKQYLVRLQNTFDLEQIELDGEGELEFETTELPFAESIGTTQDIERDGIDDNSELWGFGMGLIADDESLKYTHEGTSFRIYNAGNVPVHPFQQELKITISNVSGSSKEFELKNKTNGTTFKVNEEVKSNQVIVLDGPNITSNEIQFLRKTNKGFIELETGWNDFSIKGATSAKVEFSFLFYYL